MADLIRREFDSKAMGQRVSLEQNHTHLVMRLWCPSCRALHLFALADIEKIVHELNFMFVDAHGYRDDSDGDLECLVVVRDSVRPEVHRFIQERKAAS